MEEFKVAFDAASPERKEAMARMGRASPGSGKGMGIEDEVLCADDPLGFVTSDNPCTWFDPEAYKLQPIYRSPGLGSATIEVTLPISPRQCLIITHNRECQGYIDVVPRVVDELNHRHVAHCNESFIAHNQTTRPCWFEQRAMPEDAWEEVRERMIASGEWPAQGDR